MASGNGDCERRAAMTVDDATTLAARQIELKLDLRRTVRSKSERRPSEQNNRCYVNDRPNFARQIHLDQRVVDNRGGCQNPNPSRFSAFVRAKRQVDRYAANGETKHGVVAVRVARNQRPKKHANRECLRERKHMATGRWGHHKAIIQWPGTFCIGELIFQRQFDLLRATDRGNLELAVPPDETPLVVHKPVDVRYGGFHD